MNNAWRGYAGHQKAYADRVEPGLEKALPFVDQFRLRWEDFKSKSAEQQH